MVTITYELIKGIVAPNGNNDIIKSLVDPMNKHFPTYNINTPLRVAHFLGQAAEETAHFTTLREIGSLGYFQKRYGARKGIPPLDKKNWNDLNYWFIGRGIFQLTFVDNYKQASEALGIDFVSHPNLALEPENAVLTACNYWKKNNLAAIADKNDMVLMTKRINGGKNGLDERIAYTKKALHILER